MNRFAKLVSALACVSLATAAASVANAEPVTHVFQVSGIVRTICRVEFANPIPIADQGIVEFGTMTQLCNNREGYRIVMHHPAGLQNAHFEVGGVVVPLSSGTETVIVESDAPAFRENPARLQLASNASLDSVSFQMQPLGAIY